MPPIALLPLILSAAVAADLQLAGPWHVQVRVGPETPPVSVSVARPEWVRVTGERHPRLPLFDPKAASWRRGIPLAGVKAQECTSRGLLDPASVMVRIASQTTALARGRDYQFDPEWGTLGRTAVGRISAETPVEVDYRHGLLRLDSIVLDAQKKVVLREGTPHAAAPLPPTLEAGEIRLANVWLPGVIDRLTADQLFPVLEDRYPEPPPESPSPAEQLLPKTIEKLRVGQKLKILAWGDSVTVGTFLPGGTKDRWQEQFVARLTRRFPKATIELLTEAWGGRNTSTYLAEPPGSAHNYREKVLAVRPDLVVSEFVNDAGLGAPQVEKRYGQLLADFRGIGAEWIILTPHYVRPDWMKLTRQREIDDDPRPYVAALREFAPAHHVALADASLRWGRLWRQGIPYQTLLLNAINHPDARGMALFADSLMALFPPQ